MKQFSLKGLIIIFPLSVCLLLCGCSEDIFYIRKYEGSISSWEYYKDPSAAGSTAAQPAETSAAATPTETSAAAQTTETAVSESRGGLLRSPKDIALHDTDGQGKNYAFTYAGASFQAVYTPDNWKIIDSYLITNAADIAVICEALRREHPIHGADMKSERTAEDMAYEWEQHNLAYSLLPADSPYRANVEDVDINPADQGKSAYNMYLDRQG